ncbi:MAG: hypothetical protein ACXQS7_04975 [Candidatus Syntropharchaeia archaeon]
MKAILIDGKMDSKKLSELCEKLKKVDGFRGIVMGYRSTQVLLAKGISEAVEIIKYEGFVIEKIKESGKGISNHISI